MDMQKRRVYIPNKSFRDYKGVEQFGEITYLTNGAVNRFKVNTLYQELWDGLEDARPGDYILVSSLSILVAIMSSIMAYKFGRVNFLQYDGVGDKYVPREVVLDEENNFEPPTVGGEVV